MKNAFLADEKTNYKNLINKINVIPLNSNLFIKAGILRLENYQFVKHMRHSWFLLLVARG